MILTLTINPAVDQTLWVNRLTPGEVNRFRESQLDPAGKGINVSRMARRLGYPTIAFGFLAGEIGHLVQRALDLERVQSHFLHVEGQTRINVTIVEQERRVATSLYGPGPAVGPAHLQELLETVDFWLQAGRVLVLAGSLPPGLPPDTYAEFTRRARTRGVRVLLDCDGEALRLGVEARPDVIKPNAREASALLGRPLQGRDDLAVGARELVARGVGTVVISMGAEGAICATRERTLLVRPPRVHLLSTVGSGDSLVAGLAVALARSEPLELGMRLGTAAGAATAMSTGTALGSAAEVAALMPQVEIEEL